MLKFQNLRVDLVDELATAHEELEEAINKAVAKDVCTYRRARRLQT
jgi:hypothetical protein